MFLYLLKKPTRMKKYFLISSLIFGMVFVVGNALASETTGDLNT